MDVAKMVARKDGVVKQNNDGILYLLKKNKVASSTAAALREGGRGWLRDQGPGAGEETLGQARHRGDRLQCPRVAGCAIRRGEHPLQRRRAAHRRRAEEAGPDRLGRDRPGDGLGLAPPGRGGDHPRRSADFPGRGGRADRQGSQEGLRQAGPEDRAGREGRRNQVRQEGRERSPTPTPRARRRRWRSTS